MDRRSSVCVTRLGDKVWSFTKLDNIALSKNYTRPRKNAKSAFFHNGDDWLYSSQLSSDINAFSLKKNQTIYYSGLCGDESIYMGG